MGQKKIVRLVEIRVQRWLTTDEGKKIGGGHNLQPTEQSQNQHQPNEGTHATPPVKKDN